MSAHCDSLQAVLTRLLTSGTRWFRLGVPRTVRSPRARSCSTPAVRRGAPAVRLCTPQPSVPPMPVMERINRRALVAPARPPPWQPGAHQHSTLHRQALDAPRRLSRRFSPYAPHTMQHHRRLLLQDLSWASTASTPTPTVYEISRTRTHTHTQRERERERQRQTDRQTDR